MPKSVQRIDDSDEERNSARRMFSTIKSGMKAFNEALKKTIKTELDKLSEGDY